MRVVITTTVRHRAAGVESPLLLTKSREARYQC